MLSKKFIAAEFLTAQSSIFKFCRNTKLDRVKCLKIDSHYSTFSWSIYTRRGCLAWFSRNKITWRRSAVFQDHRLKLCFNLKLKNDLAWSDLHVQLFSRYVFDHPQSGWKINASLDTSLLSVFIFQYRRVFPHHLALVLNIHLQLLWNND